MLGPKEIFLGSQASRNAFGSNYKSRKIGYQKHLLCFCSNFTNITHKSIVLYCCECQLSQSHFFFSVPLRFFPTTPSTFGCCLSLQLQSMAMAAFSLIRIKSDVPTSTIITKLQPLYAYTRIAYTRFKKMGACVLLIFKNIFKSKCKIPL